MVSSDDETKEIDDKIKEIDSKIQEAYKGLKNLPWHDPKIFPYLTAQGELLAYTSEKSTLTTDKLALSVNKLYESSKRLELFNARLVLLTIFLVIFTLALVVIPPDTPSSVKYIAILFFIVLVIILFPLRK